MFHKIKPKAMNTLSVQLIKGMLVTAFSTPRTAYTKGKV